MAIYIALLKGINVSGKNMIKMAELKRLMEEAGFRQVETYINSGNLLFPSDEEEEALRRKIEDIIAAGFGLSIPVVLRTAEELRRILAESPFSGDVEPSGKNVNVGLMREALTEEAADKLAKYKGADDYRIIGREIHLLFRQSVADSKLANQVPKIGGYVTVRNWNTMNKLAELAGALAVKLKQE